MKQESIFFTNSNDIEVEDLEIITTEEPQPIVAGKGQCLVGGCSCTQMKGMSICGTCGHSYNDHQDIGFH